MDKQNVAYACNGMPGSLKKDRNPVTCYDMDEPQRHYAKRNKPITKRQMLFDSTYMRSLKESKIIETGSRKVVAKGWREEELVFKLVEFQFYKMEKL